MESIGFIKDKFGVAYEVQFKSNKINDRTHYTFYVYPPTGSPKEDIIAGSEFDVYDGEQYGEVDYSSVNDEYKGKGIYPSLLISIKNFFKSRGLKGIFSQGNFRSIDATTAWEKLPNKQTTDYLGIYKNYKLESKMLLSRDKIIKIAEAMNKYGPGLKVWIHFPITEDLTQCIIDEATRDKVLLSIPEDSDLFGAPKFWFKKVNIVGTVSDAYEKDI